MAEERAMSEHFSGDERRLGDRILHALELALDQRNLEVSELLCKALETALTGFGGAGAVDKRPVPESILGAFERLDRLRHEVIGGRESVG